MLRSCGASEHRAARARAALVRMGGYARAHRLETSSCAHACAGVVRWSIKVMTESYVYLHAKREIPNWGLVSAQSDGRCEVGIALVPKVLASSSSYFPFILVILTTKRLDASRLALVRVLLTRESFVATVTQEPLSRDFTTTHPRRDLHGDLLIHIDRSRATSKPSAAQARSPP